MAILSLISKNKNAVLKIGRLTFRVAEFTTFTHFLGNDKSILKSFGSIFTVLKKLKV